MARHPTADKQRSGFQVSLGGIMIFIAFLALVLSIVAERAHTRSPHIVGFTLGMLAILTIPVLILWLLIRYSPPGRKDERDMIDLVAMTLIFLILISLSVFVNRF